MNNLAVCYENGKGTVKNLEKAGLQKMVMKLHNIVLHFYIKMEKEQKRI